MKINELKVTALGTPSKIKATPIASNSTPKMDLEFKTDIVAPKHTNSNPDYTQEIAPDGIPQDAWNTLRDQHYAPKPESEWSNTPNKYTQKILDLRQKGINAFNQGVGWLKDKWDLYGEDKATGLKHLPDAIRGNKKYPQNWKAAEQPVWTGESTGNLNRMRSLAGLMEKDEDVWAYSPQDSSDIVARIVKTDHGFQVYVRGPFGWIAQGQPHMSQEEAQEDAKSFFEAASMVDFDKLNEEELKEIYSALELNEDTLTEEELNEFLPAVAGAAAVAGAGYAGYKWLKGLKGKVKDRKVTHQSKIDQALKDSIDSNPWWRDMDSTLQEMKAEIMETPKKK